MSEDNVKKKARKKAKKPEWKCIGEVRFDKDTDIIITDPCYLRHGHGGADMDWDDLEAWIGARGLVSWTYYGDWGCTVYRSKAEVGDIPKVAEKLGEFCADAGKVCVLSMQDARELHPNIDEWARVHDWCATVIRGFCGTVRLMTLTKRRSMRSGKERVTYLDTELRVHGVGTIDHEDVAFESVQTAL